jgi:hypothetical protein
MTPRGLVAGLTIANIAVWGLGPVRAVLALLA